MRVWTCQVGECDRTEASPLRRGFDRWRVCAQRRATVNDSFPKVHRNLQTATVDGQPKDFEDHNPSHITTLARAVRSLDVSSIGPYGCEIIRECVATFGFGQFTSPCAANRGNGGEEPGNRLLSYPGWPAPAPYPVPVPDPRSTLAILGPDAPARQLRHRPAKRCDELEGERGAVDERMALHRDAMGDRRAGVDLVLPTR